MRTKHRFLPFAVTMKGQNMRKEIIQQDSNNVQIYTVKDIASILNISERSAYNFVNKTNEFKVLRIGRTLRVAKDSFNAWLLGENDAVN